MKFIMFIEVSIMCVKQRLSTIYASTKAIPRSLPHAVFPGKERSAI